VTVVDKLKKLASKVTGRYECEARSEELRRQAEAALGDLEETVTLVQKKKLSKKAKKELSKAKSRLQEAKHHV